MRAQIFLSIWYFGNDITMANIGGIILVTAGVFAYNHARIHYPAPVAHALPYSFQTSSK